MYVEDNITCRVTYLGVWVCCVVVEQPEGVSVCFLHAFLLLRDDGTIHSISRIMSNVMGSAAEEEIGAAYINGQEAVLIRTLLCELGHPQPARPIQVDNSTSDGFANDTIKQNYQKRSTCAFIGYATAQANVSSSSTGSPALLTWATITPSTINRRTIS